MKTELHFKWKARTTKIAAPQKVKTKSSPTHEFPHPKSNLRMTYGARMKKKRDFETYDGEAPREERKKPKVQNPIPQVPSY
jgi:hypothetical protein